MSQARALAHLLDTLDALGWIARHLHPPQFAELVAALGDRDAALRAAAADAVWAEPLRVHIAPVVEATLRACDGLRAAAAAGEFRQTYRAMRHVSRALEALYPLASVMPTVSRFFLASDDAAVGTAQTGLPTGVMHFANATGERGGYSLYVPEDYDPAHAYPLVMALHGGAGHGRLFLWSWLREARGRGVILATPTALGDTWSLMEPQVDGANLARILAAVVQRWAVDRSRLLLTGMSDGGTFSLLSGLEDASAFTHLAPVAASFHPLLLAMVDPHRVAGLPVYLVHGALDWMFPVATARSARRALTAAGARVTYREIADLSHAYPREENSGILNWLLAQAA